MPEVPDRHSGRLTLKQQVEAVTSGSRGLIVRFGGVWTLSIGVRMRDSGALKRTALTSLRMPSDLEYGT